MKLTGSKASRCPPFDRHGPDEGVDHPSGVIRLIVVSPGVRRPHPLSMPLRPTLRLPWDDLDAEGCAEHGAPDWNTLIVVGPARRRDQRGHVPLEWTATVQCQPRP
jgi:hypothetical protein